MPRNARNDPFTTHICIQLNSSASTWAFQFIAAPAFPFTSISRHFSAAFRSLSYYISHLARLQFMAYFNQVIASAVFTLQAFLQLKYQGVNDQNQSVFATHPAAMRVAVASSVVYYLAYAALIRFPFSSLAQHVLVSSAYISVASLASALLTDTAAVFVYAIFGSLSAVELLYMVHQEQSEVESWIQTQRRRFLLLLNNLWRRRRESFPGQRLPV